MMLDKTHMEAFLEEWMLAWNRHDLDGVLRPMAEDVVFEHWNGRTVHGKRRLELAWQPWFAAHGNFRFDLRETCFDPAQQALTFEWRLDWPSPEASHAGLRELREGVDVIRLADGKIIAKRSYIKTLLKMETVSDK
jgi:hypothetical protein